MPGDTGGYGCTELHRERITKVLCSYNKQTSNKVHHCKDCSGVALQVHCVVGLYRLGPFYYFVTFISNKMP